MASLKSVSKVPALDLMADVLADADVVSIAHAPRSAATADPIAQASTEHYAAELEAFGDDSAAPGASQSEGDAQAVSSFVQALVQPQPSFAPAAGQQAAGPELVAAAESYDFGPALQSARWTNFGLSDLAGTRELHAASSDSSGREMCTCSACTSFTSSLTDPMTDADAAPGAPGSLQTLANYLRVGYWTDTGRNSRWINVDDTGTGANFGVVYYNVSGYSGDSNGISDARKVMAREAFNIYEEVLGINFVETTSTSTAVDIFFGDNQSGAYQSAVLYAGTGGAIDYSIINVAASWSGSSSNIGGTNGYTFQTFMHEIGHALGLGHQGNYNAGVGTPTYANSAIWENDSWQLTMMSYWDQGENTSASTAGVSYAQLVSPMAVDWIALNNLYAGQGFGSTTFGTSQAFAGNTIWGVGTNISAATSAAYNGLAGWADTNAFTIVDGSGIDTVNFSNYGSNQRIDLTEASAGSTTGTRSNIGGLVGNMTIAVGTVIENAISGSGNDTIIGNNANNVLWGGGGNDSIDGAGGTDTLYGGTGNDTLYGGFVTDTLYGEDGDDTLRVRNGEFYDNSYGGNGTDTLDHFASTYSGTTFDFEAGLISGTGINGATAVLSSIELYYDGSGGNTIISDGNSNRYYGFGGNDYMVAEIGGETMDGGTGTDTIDLSRWNGAYIVDMGTGSSNYGNELFTNFENLISGGGNDSITGTTGSNVITTGAGNDTVNAGSGSDTVNAGDGDDTIIDTQSMFSSGTEDDVYNGGAGIDTLVHDLNWVSSVTFDLTAGFATFSGNRDQLISIENLTVGGSATVRGNAVANVLTVNGSGANVINGEGGNDTINAGGGNDTINAGSGNDSVIAGDGDDTIIDTQGMGAADDDVYNGGAGIDTLVHDLNWVSSVTFDLTAGFSSFNGNRDQLISIENLTVGGSATVRGNGGANVLIVNGVGANLIYGMGGNDTIDGGGGDDTIDGGGGADSIVAGLGNDSVRGGGGNDTIEGGDGDDTIDGGTGADSLVGGFGNDLYIVDNVGDIAGEVAGGIDTVQASVTYTLSANLENLTLTGTADRDGTGNSQANVITGNSGDNELYGLLGNDTINGGDGDDTLDGGTGNDSMSGGLGDDVYGVDSALDVVTEAFGAGTDTVVTALSTYTLGANVENLTLNGIGSQTGNGNGLANVIIAQGSGDKLIEGFGNHDRLVGAGGDDTIRGGGGNDTVIGGGGTDSLFGGDGNDSITGGGGNDTLNGGAGNDTLRGNTGNDDYVAVGAGDVLIEGANQGYDRVFATIDYTLTANFEYLELTGGANNDGTGNGLANTLVGNSGNNALAGLGGADVLYGKGGNDTLDAGVDAVEDQFVFDTALNAATNVDTLLNAQFGEDQILLDNDIFGALLSNLGTNEGTLSASYYFEGTGVGGGASAGIGIWYNLNNGRLYYNPTDNVAGDNILFAVIDGAPASLSNTDFTLFTDVG